MRECSERCGAIILIRIQSMFESNKYSDLHDKIMI